MACIIAYPVILSVVLPAVNTLSSFYQSVDANCSDLNTVHSFDDHKIASGEWFDQYASYGEEGQKCFVSHAVERGTKNYVDILFYDKKTKSYEQYTDDLLYHPERPGIYTTSNGATLFILGADPTSYIYCIQCLEHNGETKVIVDFSTREREITAKEEKVYQKISAKLAKKNLLPKMFKISQEDCPPEYKLKLEKPV